MEKINRAQAFSRNENTPGYMLAKKTLELNPNHPVMKLMLERVKDGDGELDEATTEYADLLYNMAILNSGFLVENPMDLTEPLEKLIKVGFGLARDEPVVPLEITIEDEEEEEDEGEEDEGEDADEVDLDHMSAHEDL